MRNKHAEGENNEQLKILKTRKTFTGDNFAERNALRCGIKGTRGTDKCLSWEIKYVSCENTREGKSNGNRNFSAMWEKIMEKGYFRMRKYSRGKQHTIKEKYSCEEKHYIDKDSGSS